MKAVFLDRDGVINHDYSYVHKIEDFKFINGVFEALKLLQENGFKLILITNQSGIGVDKYTKEDFNILTEYMVNELAKHNIKLDSLHHCPHHPDAGCDCRKPARGMIDQALQKLDIDFVYSYLVGDKTADIKLGNDLGCKTFLTSEGSCAKESQIFNVHPTYEVKNLLEAAKIILDIDKKIKPLHELKQIIQNLKQEGKKIVTLNGSFDLLHAGHIYSVREAKKQGDVLVVGLNSDNSIKQYKSKDRPIIPERDRAELIAALEDVNYVTILPYDAITPNHFIDIIQPHVHANGIEYGSNCIEADTVKKYGTLYLIPRIAKDTLSTTDILRKIQSINLDKKECKTLNL